MGHYTRFKFASTLRSDTPAEVIDLLSAVADGDWSRAEAIAPDHAFFKADRWAGVLRGIHAAPKWPEADGKLMIVRNSNGSFNFAFHSSTKNYDSEIDKFLAWIGPHIASVPGAVVGEYEDENSWYSPTTLIAQASRIDKFYPADEDESVATWPNDTSRNE